MEKILVIEDDLTFVKTLEGYLSKLGYQVESAYTADNGLKRAIKENPDLILLDNRLPDKSGMEILSDLHNVFSRPQVILMTGFSEIRTAVKAMKLGAYDYITKPVNPDELKMLVQSALAKRVVVSAHANNATPVSKPEPKKGQASGKPYVHGRSLQSRLLHEHMDLVAPTDMTVLILGESGTGKEYVARRMHQKSKRANATFVAVDCGALTEELAISELFGHVKGSFTGAHQDKDGQFVLAKGGTLFLDEVGNLSYEVQVKLLRALQERVIQPLGSNESIRTDVRILTATNENLLERVREGAFREDLYHRINEFKIEVPALIERKDDFWEFATHFREAANVELDRDVPGFDERVTEIFNSYSWPGNLRELRNVVRRAVLLTVGSGLVKSVSLPPEMSKNPDTALVQPTSPYDLKAQKEISEREMIIKTLKEAKYNKSRAAKLLNIDRKTLYLKISKYDIDM